MAGEVPAVGAAVRILERLAADWPRAVSPGTLVSELRLNRSTCYNILATLHKAGWAASLGDRAGWTLGPRLLTLTGASNDLVSTMVQQELDTLIRQVGFMAFVAERDGRGEYVVITKAERQAGVRVTVGIGDTFPFSAPALMQAFCAWLEPKEFDALADRYGITKFTPRTVTERRSVHALLARVREDGFSRSIGQFDVAQGGVAAPIFDRRGRPYRVACCLAFSTELNEENVERVGALVRACADRITARTSGVVPAGYKPAAIRVQSA